MATGALEDVRDELKNTRELHDAITVLALSIGDVSSDLGKRVAELESERDALERHEGLARFPDEILSHIFVLGLEETDDGWPVTLSHVNQRFRGVSLATSSLWCTISLDFSKYSDKAWDGSDSLIPDLLHRSARQLINIELRHEHGVTQNVFMMVSVVSFMQLVSPHVARWRRFELRCGTIPLMNVALSYCRDAAAPALEDLVLEFLDYRCSTETALPRQLFNGGVPSLQFAYCSFGLIDLCPFKTLTNLEVQRRIDDDIRIEAFHLPALLDLLVSLPELTTFLYDVDIIECLDDIPSDVIILPRLRTLTLVSSTTCGIDSIKYFIDSVAMPSLKQLTLRPDTCHYPGDDISWKGQCVSNLFCAMLQPRHRWDGVESFTFIHALPHTFHELDDLLPRMTSLVRISFQCYVDHSTLQLLGNINMQMPCLQKLEVLSFEGCLVRSGTLHAALEARMEDPQLRPLRRLEFVHCTGDDKFEQGAFDSWVTEHVVWES